MNSFRAVFVLLSVIPALLHAQPLPTDSNTVALWHFDESSGQNIFDSSPYHNNGIAYGTTIVPGMFGNARSFAGNGNHIYVPNPTNGVFNFSTTQSFTIDAWFKTTQADTGEILRRGLAPVPGYLLRILNGRVQGVIGDREDMPPPSMLLRITSTALYNDGNWHHATLIRDRSQGKLFLYVDEMQAAPPLNDNFTLPITNDRPLMIGRWENYTYPTYFRGSIDEVKVVRGARHPVTATSDTVALWHLDESSGQNIFDSSPYHNNGTAYGTTVVPGMLGNARSFGGHGDYVSVPNPANGVFNFPTTQSFTIDAWFKTTQADTGEIIRRGLAPVPGYALRIFQGRVQGIIGDREDSYPPSMLLRITSAALYNDGNWHHAVLVRDRSQGKLFLYVDEVQAAQPLNDTFTLPISSDRPLMIGRWENYTYPTYFRGSIDEVKIVRGARHPVTATSDTVALWHLDDPAGQNVLDSSPYHNNGTAHGTTVVPGMFGNARSFGGHGDYVSVPNPATGVFNFPPSQSFTIDAWFKTTQADTGEILRRGLAPVPGYLLRILNGRVQGVIGDREDMPPPSMLLRITSTSTYNDGNWHHAVLVRDRSQGKLHLYVDDIQAASPLNDNFALAITNDRPLMIGRWENYTYPTYFSGIIDEVRIFRGARHPGSFFAPDIRVSPLAVEFGSVVVGTPAQQNLEILNAGTRDTLRVTGIASNNPLFSASANTLVVPPGTSRAIQIRYLPTTARIDTASLSIASNDPEQSVVRVFLRGRGVQLGAAPIISSIRDIPNDQGKQVRVTWYRSIYDGLNDSLHVATYSLWRRVEGGFAQLSPPYPPEGATLIQNGHTYLYSTNELWDFIVTVPAVRFEQYAYVSPTLFDSTVHGGTYWTAFKVSAHTTTGVIFFSLPDSGYSVDNLPPRTPANFSAVRIPNGVQLRWEAPSDPDIRNYVVHRSTQTNFIPSPLTWIGSPSATNHTDNQVAGLGAVYYRIATMDSAGNQSEYSEEIGLVLTGSGGGSSTPTQFALNQNYPNPFNPGTIIEYDVPIESHVVVAIFDVNGKELERLVDEQRPVGSFRVSWKPTSLATGIYFCRMIANTYSSVRKIAYIK